MLGKLRSRKDSWLDAGRLERRPLQIGAAPDHDFDEPLGLLSDCHRRIEHFLDILIEQHICIEDRDVFPAAARLLSATQIHEVGREMAERRMLRTQKR